MLSAACLDGFLVECLKTYAIGNRFASKDTFEGRLEHDFLNRISRAMFKDFPSLFQLTLGKPLHELITDAKLNDGYEALKKFRNVIAHGRSMVTYFTTEHDEQNPLEFCIEGNYGEVHKYLETNHLIFGQEDLFTDKVADHFAALIKPYINAVIALLPVPQSDNLKQLVFNAYRVESNNNRA